MAANFDLIVTAEHVLNWRKRGREERIAKLLAAGLPANDHAALARWHAAASRDRDQANGTWFRGESIRVDNGSECDLPKFGKFGCVIREARPVVRFVEGEDGGWSYGFFGSLGISGGLFDSAEEALRRAEGVLASEGFVRDWREAAASAEVDARSRHDRKMVSGGGYRKLFS